MNLTRVIVVLTGVLLVSPAVPANGQDQDAGKEIVKGLLRALVESQLEREGSRGHWAPQPGRPGPGGVNPGAPGQGAGGPGRPGNVHLPQLRTVMATMAQEMNTLTALLNTDARRSFAVRRLLGDALRLQATTSLLRQRVEREQNLDALLPGFLSLHVEWSTFSHQLMQTAALSPQTVQSIERIHQLNAQYATMLGIQEQFDNRDLVRAADTLAAELHGLADELNFLPGASTARFRLIAALRSIEQSAHLLANLASDAAPFQSVVNEYMGIARSWQAVRPQLAAMSGRSVTRAIARIEDTHRTIHQLLRLDYGIDPALSLQMATQLQRDVGTLFRSITLDQMMVLRDHRAIAIGADVMAGSVENLVDVITRNEDRNVIGEAWFYVDEAWRVLAHYLSPIQTPEVQSRLAGISQSVDGLRSAIGVQVAFDQNLIAQQAVALKNTAGQIQTAFRRWESQAGTSLGALNTEVDQLEARCLRLEEFCRNQRDQRRALAQCDGVIATWQGVRPQLLMCPTEERDALERLSDSFTQDVVRLRMMLGE